MSFKELQTLPEFIKLDSQRFGVLSCLDALKDAIDGLPTDKPSWRSFSKVEANVEVETSNLNGINKKIAVWYNSKGGKHDDTDFVEYRKKASALLSTIEKAQSAYFDVLSSAGLVPVQPKPEVSGDLLGISKSLTATQKAAVEAQTSSNKNHKS